MGIDPRSRAFLRAAAASGVEFRRTITIGRQDLYGAGAVVPADDVFRELGATELDALDNSPYEGATVLHDLNQPLPAGLAGQYTAVFDGGSLEHVFDVATALRTCMDLVAPGGHYLAASPGNNQMGHGFYQFSPEFYYRGLSAHGFTVRGVLAVERRLLSARWYAAKDPAAAGRRMQVRSRHPVELFVLAQRTGAADAAEAPQQSDYVAAWTSGPAAPPATLRSRVRGHLPPAARTLLEDVVGRRYTSWRGAGFEAVPAGTLPPSAR